MEHDGCRNQFATFTGSKRTDGGNACENISRVSNTGICQHSFRISTAQCCNISPCHGNGRDCADENGPIAAIIGQRDADEDTHESNEAHRLARGRKNARNRSTGSRIGIGCSEMEWNGTDLETKRDQHHSKTDGRQSIRSFSRPLCSKASGAINRQITIPDVQHGDTVQANGTGHTTDDEILHTCFGTHLRLLVERDEHIGCHARQFKTDK